jgi:hypothetical protein
LPGRKLPRRLSQCGADVVAGIVASGVAHRHPLW